MCIAGWGADEGQVLNDNVFITLPQSYGYLNFKCKCVRACACVRACVCVCLRAFLRACLRVFVCVYKKLELLMRFACCSDY